MENINEAINSVAKDTEEFFYNLENCHKGYVPTESSAILDKANLERVLSLTKSLSIWVTTTSLSDGDLVLAYANLGSIVESWLMIFYAVYCLDYKNDVISEKKEQYIKGECDNTREVISPEDLSFELLKQFTYDNIFKKNQYNKQEWISMGFLDFRKKNQEVKTIRNWIDEVQAKRNAIHSFMKRDVGDSTDLYESIITFKFFVDSVLNKMPPFGEN